MESTAFKVIIPVDGECCEFSAILLRDLCQCSACIHHSTRQKLYSTADIPRAIRARDVALNRSMDGVVEILWSQDVPGYDSQHTTNIDIHWLREVCRDGVTPGPFKDQLPPQTLWDAGSCDIVDLEYNAYMQNDAVLYKAIVQLRTHGLVFIANVPDSTKSVSTMAERIGSVKSTFYGDTWDGRSGLQPTWCSHADIQESTHRTISHQCRIHFQRLRLPCRPPVFSESCSRAAASLHAVLLHWRR